MRAAQSTLTLLAPAKINLFLEVEGRRRDGYHTLLSVMQALSFGDEITLSLTDNADLCGAEDGILFTSDRPLPEENSLIKAARLFREHYRRTKGSWPFAEIRMTLTKRIPAEAGLGGGSSDASAVLLGLNRLTGAPFSEDELLPLALTLGADMPFFLRGGCRSVRGIGEVLGEALPPLPFHLVIAKGSAGSATPGSYGALDRLYAGFSDHRPKEKEFLSLLSALREGDRSAILSHLYNIFEAVVCPLLPEVPQLKERLASLGAEATLMSGSGSAVFGLFSKRESAEAAAETLTRNGFFATAAEPL